MVARSPQTPVKVSATKTKLARHTSPADTTKAVDEFMQALDHPFKAEVQALRKIVLNAHQTVSEGVKWNAPSFRTTEYFATINLRVKGGVGVVLHLGAKVRDNTVTGISIKDPAALLTWPAKDRATISFTDAADITAKQASFTKILRQWITYV